MLNQKYPKDKLRTSLLPRSEYRPHPTIEDRTKWAALPRSVARAHHESGQRYLGADIPSLPATVFLEFSRNGNRRNYELLHFGRRGPLEQLVVAECLENEGRFLDDIVNRVWAICEESYWGVPAHIRVQQAGNTLPDVNEPTVDLFAAETANLLSWTSYLLGERLDTVSPLVRDRIASELNRRFLTPLLERDDFGWMGFNLGSSGRRVNNWNPWICSNWLASVLLMEEDEARRVEAVSKILRTVDNFIDPYPEDGGCDEGPGYWGRAGASLFDTLDLLHYASGGTIDVYDQAKIREIAAFVYRVHISGDYYINFADAPALVYPDAALVYRYGQAVDDPKMMEHGAWLARRQRLHEQGRAEDGDIRMVNFQRLLRGLFSIEEIPVAEGGPPCVRDVWLPEIEVMVARDREGSDAGFFVGAKGGHNQESHNHNDVGCFVVYLDGRPLLVDAGVETYTARTFGPERYEIWTMRSSYHTLLPTIDEVEQLPGSEYAARESAYEADEQSAGFTADIAPAYPSEAGIGTWKRTIHLQRDKEVSITDEYALTDTAGEISVSLLTPCAVNCDTPGTIRLEEREMTAGRRTAQGAVSYPSSVFAASVEEISIHDERCGRAWGEKLFRVVLSAKNPELTGTLRYSVSR